MSFRPFRAARDPVHAPPLAYTEFVAIIALLMALNAAAIDIYIPALAEIGAALDASDENRRQLVIGAYITAFGAAQVIYGTLADRFGRRPVLFAGLAVYVAAALGAALATSFGMLLAMRAIQGVGAAATRVIAISVVRDRFRGPQMARVMSLVMMVFMIMPVVAPNLGSLVLLFGSWRELSAIMCVLGLVALAWAWARLPETLAPRDRRSLAPDQVIAAFRIVVTNRAAFGYTLATATAFGVLLGFITQAEQIYTEVYALGASFTLYFALVAVFMAAASFANSRLVERLGERRLSHGALIAILGLSVLHAGLAWAWGGATPFWLFLVFLILTFCAFGFVPTNFNALAMEPMGRVAGTASSVTGAVQTLGGGILGSIVGYLYDGTLIPMLTGFAVLAAAGLALAAFAERGALCQAPEGA